MFDLAKELTMPEAIRIIFPNYRFYALESMVAKDVDHRIVILVRYKDAKFVSIRTSKMILAEILDGGIYGYNAESLVEFFVKRVNAAIEAT